MDHYAQSPVRPLLERCLLGNDNDAWTEFLARYAELIRQAVRATPTGGPSVEQFADLFPGWLFANRKLHALYRAVLARSSELLTPAAEEEYVRNYLVGMVRSAVADWFRSHRTVPVREVPESPPPPEEEFADAVTQVRGALQDLPVELRVPFWVRHVRALGSLPPADLDWLAGAAGRTTAEVAQAIACEADSQDDPDRPLSSRFISQLLRLPPLNNGKAAAVDQRVRRARKLLRTRLRPED